MTGGPTSEGGARFEGDEVWVALCTAPDAAVAERLARAAVEQGRAACANLVPGVRSIYRWQGGVEDAAEVLIVFKTTAGAFSRLADLVREQHPYEVPELVAMPVAAGLQPYLSWVLAESVRVDRLGRTV